MGGDAAARDDLQAQLDELTRQVTASRREIHALTLRADASTARADASDARADELAAQALVDREMIAELQSEGVLSREHAGQMEQALRSSRTIGSAIGLIMASRHVGEDEAFLILKTASQNSNRKVRELAADMVTTADPSAPEL